jgi:hypothetical protein
LHLVCICKWDVFREKGTLETELEIHVRGFKKGGDNCENICVALRGIVESGSVDQNDRMSIQVKSASNVNLLRAGF